MSNIVFTAPSRFFTEVNEVNEAEIAEIVRGLKAFDACSIGNTGGSFVRRIRKLNYDLVFVYTAKGAESAFGDTDDTGEFIIEYISESGNIGYEVNADVNRIKAKILSELFEVLDPSEFANFSTILSEE